MKKGIIERYRARLPVTDKTPVVTLQEGDTPLLPAPRLAKKAGLPENSVFLKFEGGNPTGSFKDRGMTLAVSKALEEGAKAVICASTGNTAASAAAYAARAGLRCIVLLPGGAVALGKVSQALVHGAEVVQVAGNFDDALNLVRGVSARHRFTVVNSTNPYRLQGQKTGAFEIVDQLGRAPTHQFMPVGNAGNITAYWLGYKELGGGYPKMCGFQAAGAAPIVKGKIITEPKTIATAIRIGNPASWQGAVTARNASGGLIEAVSDREILAAYAFLAKEEAVFCEPSSATGVAGLLKKAAEGYFKDERDLRIVCVLTGHGLKDPEQPGKMKFKIRRIAATAKAFEKIL